MDLHQKIRSIPASPGVYLYKNADGEVIYVGKAKSLRHRVSSYFHEGRVSDAKTGTLLREAVDVDYIVVANNKEALALENHLIKQKKPRFNILLRDDKTYPYVKLTLGRALSACVRDPPPEERRQRLLRPLLPCQSRVSNRRPDPSQLSGSFVQCRPQSLASTPMPAVLHRTLPGPLRRRPDHAGDLSGSRPRCEVVSGRATSGTGEVSAGAYDAAAEAQEFERAAKYRDLISTVEQLQEKQRIAAVEGDDADVFGYHYENGMLAVNLFHMRGGRVLDRREFFWEDLPEFEAIETSTNGKGTASSRAENLSAEEDGTSQTRALPASARPQGIEFIPSQFFSQFLTQLYIGQPYVPRNIYVPVDFDDREALEELLSEQLAGEGGRATRVHITVPSRGDKRSLIDLAANNAKQLYDQRFRVMKPNARAIQEALQDALALPEPPNRIECFDISHIQGAETVASMVVWEDGKMKKSDYRKFIIRSVDGVDDFASMREVVGRRYQRVQNEKKEMPSLILIDGGLGQLHAASDALASLQIINQPLASIAKREEIIYVCGQEDDPVVLDHHNPVLHLVQLIRDEAHRFAVTFHRKRRQMRDRSTELREIPGVGERTTRRLLEHFGSLQAVKQADVAALSAVVTKTQAEAILEHFQK